MAAPASKPLVVVTGASSGIGEALAKQFSALGYPLLLLARRLDRMEALKLPNALAKAVDVTDREAVKAAIDEAEARFGPTDLLINNAGVMLLGKVVDQKSEEWDTMVDVNIKGLMYVTKAVLPGMVARGRGTIINISSVAGRKGFGNHVVYCGTKFAVHAMTETLREEVSGTGVRVIVVAPGATETELLSHTTDEKIKSDYTAWKVSMGGVVRAESVSEACRFAYEQPQNLCIREIVLAATGQAP